MVEHVLADLKGFCGVCWVVHRLKVPRAAHGKESLNACPAAGLIRDAFNTRMVHLGRPQHRGSVCFTDVGPHDGGPTCPVRVAERDGKLAKAQDLCSNCWLGEDSEQRFHEEKRWGGKQCASAYPGREFVREAVFALYHGRPDYVAEALGDFRRWCELPKTAAHYCACVDATAAVPAEMPSLVHFAHWAGSRWMNRIKVSSGVVLLVHFHCLTQQGTKPLEGGEYVFWRHVQHVNTLERAAY